MKILTLVVGPLKTNCYIVYEKSKCLIIDPGDDENAIIKKIDKMKLQPLAILLTHNHFDHTMYADSLSSLYKVPVYDYKNLFDKEEKTIGPFKFEILYTPGHSNSSMTYYFKEYDLMFVGDFIFKGTIGRVDLPGGNYQDMLASLNMIKKYDDKIELFPGHGDITTLGHEKKHNYYFK